MIVEVSHDHPDSRLWDSHLNHRIGIEEKMDPTPDLMEVSPKTVHITSHRAVGSQS